MRRASEKLAPAAGILASVIAGIRDAVGAAAVVEATLAALVDPRAVTEVAVPVAAAVAVAALLSVEPPPPQAWRVAIETTSAMKT
jgi:hypothetical protein